MSSIYIETVYPCIHSIANRDLVSCVNFRGTGDKPLGKITNFRSFKDFKTFSSTYIPDIKHFKVLIFQILI